MIESIRALVIEIRDELHLTRGVPPLISQVYEHYDGSIHIITPDRAEKSLLLGPGGRIAAELAKRTSMKITVYGEDEIILRRHRLKLALKRIEEVFQSASIEQQRFLEILKGMISNEYDFPETPIESKTTSVDNLKIGVAYSGGIDSTAATTILVENGFQPTAITVHLGEEFYSPYEIRKIGKWCEINGIHQVVITPMHRMSEIIQSTEEGKIHPCRKCHEIIFESLRDYASKEKYSIIVTGELLPNGRQSILQEEELMIIHLPACLALSKYRTELLAERSGRKMKGRKFGCKLVAHANKIGWRNIGPSIFRVLRELEGGILTTGQGLEYIKNILKPWSSERR